MPWTIEENYADCNGYAVVKEDDGSLAGCHETRESAEEQLAALYASESDKSQLSFELDAPCGQKAIKIIDPDARRIGAYATIWGELDCDNDRMTKQAIEPYLGKSAPMMFWLHGLDNEFGAAPVGIWDTTSFKVDGLGLYVEGNVSRDMWGNNAWQRITNAKSYGLSVGSLWYLVKRKSLGDGSKEIVDWPLIDISLMEGGKQCVPSAQQKLDNEMKLAYEYKANQLGLTPAATSDGGTVDEYPINLEKGVNSMSDQKESTVDINEMVAQQVDKALKAKAAAEAAERERLQAIDEAAAEKAAKVVAEKQAEWEEEKAKLEAAIKANKPQPKAPAVGENGTATKNRIQVLSPYDRLDTMDLCMRYEIMRSYGKKPSERFYKALARRVEDMAGEEDTVMIKSGQPVKKPAIDIDAIAPRNLDISEIDGELVAAKGGYDRHGNGGLDSSSDIVTPRGVAQFIQIASGALKSDELNYSTQSSYGDEWVPTLMQAQLWRTIRLEAAVLGLFDQFDMPSQPYDYPAESTDPTFYKVAESADEAQMILTGGPFSDSKVGTAKVTFTAGKLGALTYWSEEMEEDGIIAFEPQVRDQYGMKVAHTIDEVLISGDETGGASTANISNEGGTLAATSRYLVLDGLRHEPLVTTTGDAYSATTLAFADFVQTRSLMGTAGKYGVNPNDLVHIMDPGVFFKAIQLTEVKTLEVFGSAATILTGQLGAIGGIPIIVSEDFALTSVSGYLSITAANNTYGSFLTVNRRGAMVGWRRRPRIRVVGLPGAEARYIVASARLDLGFKEAGMVALGYAVTIT